jgi:hypothetical protein
LKRITLNIFNFKYSELKITRHNNSYKDIGWVVELVRSVLLATFTTGDNYSLRTPYVL